MSSDQQSRRIAEILEAMATYQGIVIPPDPTPGRYGFAEPADAASLGVWQSGSPKDLLASTAVANGNPGGIRGVQLLAAARPPTDVSPGIATIHVTQKNITALTFPNTDPNLKIVLDIEFQTGKSGGRFQVDATGGAIFSVNGANVVSVFAHFESIDEGVDPVPGNDKRLECCVQWGSSTYQPAFMTGPRQLINANATGNAFAIPEHARSMFILAPTITAVINAQVLNESQRTTLYAREYTQGNATSGVQASKLPIVAGGAFAKLTVTVAQTHTIPVFELWP